MISNIMTWEASGKKEKKDEPEEEGGEGEEGEDDLAEDPLSEEG